MTNLRGRPSKALSASASRKALRKEKRKKKKKEKTISSVQEIEKTGFTAQKRSTLSIQSNGVEDFDKSNQKCEILEESIPLSDCDKSMESIAPYDVTGGNRVHNDHGVKHSKESILPVGNDTEDFNQSSSKRTLDKLYEKIQDKNAVAKLRAEDMEIEELEKKLGLNNRKNKRKLHKEFSRLEGFGDDFGDFLDGLDDVVQKTLGESVDDRLAENMDTDESERKSRLRQENEVELSDDVTEPKLASALKGDSSLEFITSEDDSHDPSSSEDECGNTYQPAMGEDIYGNKISDHALSDDKINKYIPPHLRKKIGLSNADAGIENDKQLNFQMIRKVKGILNRLSDTTIESVSKQVFELYGDVKNSSTVINKVIMTIMFSTLMSHTQLMEKLIPLNAAFISALHYSGGKGIGAYVIEEVVTKYLAVKHNKVSTKEIPLEEGNECHSIFSKEGSNLMLFLSYLYIFGVVHCRLIYDLIRSLIQDLNEIDVEVLLMLLDHAGAEFRSDDPTALKDIVSNLKERALNKLDSSFSTIENKRNNNSRIQFMIDAIIDLKNNNSKRRFSKNKHLASIYERTKSYRKILGGIKSKLSSGGKLYEGVSDEGRCLQICLQDITDVPIRGRWWITGAVFTEKLDIEARHIITGHIDGKKNILQNDAEQEKFLHLANSAHMNTDLRKSIFVVIMSSTDCEDAFTKLLQQQLLTHHRFSVCRVLIETCVQEKSFNPFYAHLGTRLCDYLRKCKKDLGKAASQVLVRLQQDDASESNKTKYFRQASNLAKVCSYWVEGGILTLNFLRNLDTKCLSNEEGSIVLFISIFFSNILESISNKEVLDKLFTPRDGTNKTSDDDEVVVMERNEEFRQSILACLIKYVSHNPKNVKHSSFNKNLKVAVKACEKDFLNFQ